MPKADPEKLVSFIVKSIVNTKDKVSIKKTEQEDDILLEISCPKDDIGKIIGKAGSTIWAIRRLARLAGATLEKKVSVTLVE